MSASMNFLGIATPGPGASVALFDRHNILAAVEEEKLSRTNDPQALPQLALATVLAASGLRLSDIDHIALADGAAATKKSRRNNSDYQGVLAHLRQLLGGRRFTRFDHHLCHAASSFYASDFSRALILSLDHGANGNAGFVALGEDDHIKSLQSLSFPNSLGWFYSRVTQLAGLRPHRDEHKLQWLSKDGQPEFLESFRKLFFWNAKGLPALDRKYFASGPDGSGVFSPRVYRELGLLRSAPPADRAVRAALARSAQDVLEEIILQLAENFRESTGANSLCLAGGVFQNVLLVRALEKRGGFRDVFVQPVAGNAGTSLGAAFLSRKKFTGHSGRAPLASLALGPEPTSQEIKSVLDT